jgi:hypothetical protein
MVTKAFKRPFASRIDALADKFVCNHNMTYLSHRAWGRQ